MAQPDDEYGSGFEIGKTLGGLFATPPSAREKPRSPQGLKLVDQYAGRFSDTSKQLGAGVARTFTSPSDFFEPQKWQEAQSEASELAKQTPEFNAAKLRALQGGVGLPTYNKPDAPLRSELPAGTEPWAAQPSPGTAAPVLDVPVRQDDDTDYFVRQDILKTKAPDLAEFRKKPGFGTVSVKNQEGEYGEEKAPLEAETDWASEFIAKPTQFGTLSEPTLGEQVAMYPFALGAGLTEKAFETVGLDTPERAIPLGGGGIYGYETGRDAPEVLARFPEEFVGAATKRIAKGAQAFMDTPTTQEGVLGAVEDFSTATGNALEAMTDIPRKVFEWDTDDYFEMSPEREAQIQAEDPERFQRLQASRQQAREKAVAERLNPLSALPTIDVLSEDLRRVAEAFVMMPIEAVGALGDPSLTPEERAARLGDMGAGLAFSGAGSMIKSIVSPAKAVKETPVEHLFNVFMLEGGLPSLFKPKAPVTMPREAGALRRDLEEMTGERDKVQGTAKVVSEEASKLQKADTMLENLGFYQTPEALAAVDAKVVLAEAERRVAAAEEAVTRAQVGRQAVSDAVFEGATKAEADVPGAVNAGKRERVRLAEGARQKTDAEVKAEAKVTMAAAALREHTGGRPLGDWSATRREEFKARKSAEASAARPSTKNRRRGTPTLKAFERNEAAQGKFREFKPWMDEFKRLRGELKKASTEALKARESARKARQDDGRLAELSRAEEDARIAREAVRDSGKTAKGTLPKIGELKEIAKEARKEARLASARAAETEGFVQYPTAESRYVGKFELERKAQNQRVVNAGKELKVAQEALRIAREKFDNAMLRDNERLRAVETKREGAVAGEPANLRARTAQGAQPSRVPGDDPLFFERQGLEAAREELRAASKAEKDALTDGGRVFVQGEGRPARAAQGPDPARIEDAKKRRAVAEQTFAKAKSTFDAAAKAQKKSDAAAAAASRPPGIRDATKTRYALEQQLPKLKRDLEAAKAEEAAAIKVAEQQATNASAFDVLKSQHNARAGEALAGKGVTGLADLGPTPRGNTAGEWVQLAREAVAEAQAGVDGITDALRAAEQGVVAAKTAHLPPQFRQKLIDLQDEVVALTEQAKQAREFAKLADDPAMKNAQLVAERALAAKKAQLRQANAVVRRTEIQRQESFRRADAQATALRNQFALRKRAQERIEAKLRGDVTAAERRFVAATKDLANVADPLKNVVERNAKAAEALTEWSKTQEPVFQDLVRELNRLEDDFVRSESKQFWTEQLVRQVPKHLMTLGVSFVWEAAKRFTEKYLGQEGRGWVRQLAFSKGGRIPEEFVDFLENNSGRADLMKMGLETAKSQLPKEKWDLVSRWIDMQHLPEEGGFWSPGNFNFKAWEAPGHRAKYDPYTGRFKLTQEGEKHFGALVQEAMKHPEGSVERADLMAEVLRVNAEMDFMNERAMGLITQLKLIETAAAKAELPRDPESLRPIWLPQILTPEAAKKAAKRGMGERAVAEQAKGRYEARADKFTDSRGGKPPMGRDPDAPMVRTDMKEYESSQLNRDRIPMSQRAELYNMETDLGRRIDAVGRLIHDIHRREVENFIASKYALTPEQFKAKRSLEAAQQEMRGTGDVRAVPKVDKAYKFVAEDAPWVPLAGKWIPEDIYYELANMENLSREAQQIVNRSMSKWKEWRTVGNPTTSNRNAIVSSLIFAPAAGVAPYMPKNFPLYLEVFRDLFRSFNERDPLHIEMVERGKLDGTMMKVELMKDVGEEWMGAFQRGGVEPAKAFLKLAYEGPRAIWKVTTNPKKALDERAAMKAWRKEYENPKLTPEQRLEVYKRKPKPGVLASAEKSADAAYEAGRTLLNAPGTIARDYYRFGDQIVKEVAYRKWRREGMSPEAASKKLDEHFPNYNTVPGIVHILKAPHSIVGPKGEPLKSLQLVNFVFSQPFAAYTATSFPIFMKWAKENPAQGAALMALYSAINNANLAAHGLDEEKARAIEKAMPAYRRTGEKLAARYTSNPRWAKTREGDWVTVQTQFLHPLSETAITTDDTVSDTENAINVLKSLSGYGENFMTSALFSLLGIDTTSPTAPPVWQPGDENVAERVTSHLMKKLAPPLAPSLTSVMEGDLGYGPARGDPTKRIGGGTTTEGYALSQGAVPNRLGRYVSKDAFLSSQLGVKTGYTSEAESARQMSEQLKDRMVRTERDIVAGMSRQGLRINELEDRDENAWLEAQRRIVERMMPVIDQTVKRLRSVKDDPVAFEYLENYQAVLDEYNRAMAYPTNRALYEWHMKQYDAAGRPRRDFNEWARSNQLSAMEDVYDALREATGAGTRETGEARRETRTGETE